MATIGLVPLILILITRTTSILLAQIPTHPTTTLAHTAFLYVVFPFYFTRSGNIALEIGTLRVVGYSGIPWTNVASTDINKVFYLNINISSTYPSFHDVRRFGFPVRCINF